MSSQFGKALGLCFLIALTHSACARQHGEKSVTTQGAGTPVRGAAAGAAAIAAEDMRVGAKALATLEPVADIDPALEGSGIFTQTVGGVDLELRIRGCERGKSYAVFVQEGLDCSSDTLLGPHWDPPRGEGVTLIPCTGVSGGGRVYYTRSNKESKRWTIGNPSASNLLQHALVVYDQSAQQPLACGTIMRTEDVEPPPDIPTAAQPKEELRAVVAGLCLARLIVRDSQHECPKPADVTKCASAHCALDACVAQCKGYLECLEKESDPCQPAMGCELTPECGLCQADVTTCVIGFCTDVVACAAPKMPGGPCSQLEACCAMQGDDAPQCLEMVNLLERISGDPSCYGAMRDWDTLVHLKVPCKFQ